jgi:hypothetical protein
MEFTMAHNMTLKFVLMSSSHVNLGSLSTGALKSCLRRVTIPDAVTIQFDLLKMSMVLLETCRGL